MINLPFIWSTFLQALSGLPVTLKLVGVSLLISTPLAFLMAVVNLNPRRILSKIFQVYISFVRSMPILVIIFIMYYSLPLVVNYFVNQFGLNFDVYDMDNMVYGYLVFSFVSIPSLSEVFRSGLISVPPLQYEAASAVGMTAPQAYVHIIMPQVLEGTLPVICSFVTTLIKSTSLAFSMSIMDMTGITKVIAADSIRYVESYAVIFILYIMINLTVERVFKYLEKQLSKHYDRA